MAEMLIQSESLTSIADKIRVLSGTTNAMGLDAMANHVGEANTNVNTEAGLIAQIASALEGKAAGGSGGSGNTTWESGVFTITDNGMYEPGVNEYIFSASNLNISSRICIIVFESTSVSNGDAVSLHIRNSTTDSFSNHKGSSRGNIGTGTIQGNDIVFLGDISDADMNCFGFMAM